MRTKATKVSYKGSVSNRSGSKGLLLTPGDFIMVRRGVPRLVILRCPCGCGDDLLINLDKRSGPAWRLYSKGGMYTLFPSYWRDTECGSHFIIWNNKVYWCYSSNETEEELTVSEEIETLVLSTFKDQEFIHYLDLADESGLIPWECLQACKQLLNKKLCEAKDTWARVY